MARAAGEVSFSAPHIVEYLSQFTDWQPYEHRVLAQVDGQLLPMPINRDTVNRLYGLDLRTDAGGIPNLL